MEDRKDMNAWFSEGVKIDMLVESRKELRVNTGPMQWSYNMAGRSQLDPRVVEAE